MNMTTGMRTGLVAAAVGASAGAVAGYQGKEKGRFGRSITSMMTGASLGVSMMRRGGVRKAFGTSSAARNHLVGAAVGGTVSALTGNGIGAGMLMGAQIGDWAQLAKFGKEFGKSFGGGFQGFMRAAQMKNLYDGRYVFGMAGVGGLARPIEAGIKAGQAGGKWAGVKAGLKSFGEKQTWKDLGSSLWHGIKDENAGIEMLGMKHWLDVSHNAPPLQFQGMSSDIASKSFTGTLGLQRMLK